MSNKTKLAAIISILVIFGLACGFNFKLPDNAIDIGELRTDQISASIPDPTATTDVKIEFGTGKLIIQPGAAAGLFTGTATYNVDSLIPETSVSGNSVTLKQDSVSFKLGGLPNFGDVENQWELYFNVHPVALNLRTGGITGEFEFGGMAVEKLDILSGASVLHINFTTPNLTTMSEFTFTTGVSDADLLGLGNANFSLMTFKAGAGNYTLDFSGAITRDATVEVDAVASNLKIIVPSGVTTTLQLEGNLTNVTARGEWAGGANTYSLAGSGPTLTIKANIGGGLLELEN